MLGPRQMRDYRTRKEQRAALREQRRRWVELGELGELPGRFLGCLRDPLLRASGCLLLLREKGLPGPLLQACLVVPCARCALPC